MSVRGSLTAGITSDPMHRSLAASIIGIGKTLGVRVVAEGVETAEHAQLLDQMGCDVLQGFHFARPLPADKIPDLLTAWAPVAPRQGQG